MKLSSRIVALLLAPCLIADPVAGATVMPGVNRHLPQRSLFQEQAIPAPALQYPHEPALDGERRVAQQMAAEAVIATVPITDGIVMAAEITPTFGNGWTDEEDANRVIQELLKFWGAADTDQQRVLQKQMWGRKAEQTRDGLLTSLHIWGKDHPDNAKMREIIATLEQNPAAGLAVGTDTSFGELSPTAANSLIQELIEDGDAVAFDFEVAKPDTYYFEKHSNLEQKMKRLSESFNPHLSAGAERKLLQHLRNPQLIERLKNAVALLRAEIGASSHTNSLPILRYVILFGDHPSLTSGEFVAHAGFGERSGKAPAATIYVPLDVTDFVGQEGKQDRGYLYRDLVYLLEHEDFHIRRAVLPNIPYVLDDHHEYSSDDEVGALRLFRVEYKRFQRERLSVPRHNLTLTEAIRWLQALVKLDAIKHVGYDYDEEKDGTHRFYRLDLAENKMNPIEPLMQINSNLRDFAKRYSVDVVKPSLRGLKTSLLAVMFPSGNLHFYSLGSPRFRPKPSLEGDAAFIQIETPAANLLGKAA